MNDLSYAHQRFIRAADGLATGRGEIKERLADAFFHLDSIRDDRDLPGGLRHEFRELMERMTREKSVIPEEGTIQATLRAMSIDEAVAIAEQVMAMEYRVRVAFEEEMKQKSQ